MNKTIRGIILHVFFAGGLIFLVIGGPGYNAARSIRDGWDLGHAVLFILFTYILYRDWKKFADKALISQWVLVLSFTALLAAATEGIQYFVGRQFDLLDILRDLSGSAIGMLLLGKVSAGGKKAGRLMGVLLITILAIITARPFLVSIADEYIAARQFPVLANFETPFEIGRWRADGEISISGNISRGGDSSLKIEFTTKTYSPVTMKYSLGKWEEYDTLKFSFCNPDTADLKVACRVHDNKHIKHGNAYLDRFNRSFILKGGWNTFAIPVCDLRNAPSTRKMNLNRIEEISFFSMSLPVPRTVYLDDVLLIKRENRGGN
ncbi:MAG: VanZ family protein [Candidatus Krumholzibacteriota bacterium]|nr:VanZ family protein [Candidatus Krumholzibacteriota bacterium]